MEKALLLSRCHPASEVCRALGVPRAGLYRERRRRECPPDRRVRPSPPRTLSGEERQRVADLLHSRRFVDKAPAAVWAELLDEGSHLCSPRTMYRILEERQEVRERRLQLRHPAYEKPELLATAPNQCWSRDITKLKGPVKWSGFHLYVVGHLQPLCGRLDGGRPRELVLGQDPDRRELPQAEDRGRPSALHADRGSSMKSKALAMFLADPGVTKTHSRPRVCDDNPYSEAQLRTLKYRPQFPKRFGCIQDAREFCREFFRWYNTEHRHSGIGWHTPEDVHYLRTDDVRRVRAEALDAAYARNPERFANGRPVPPDLPRAAWINKPKTEDS